MTMDEKELYKKVIALFGTSSQTKIAVEEMAELIAELCRTKRADRDISLNHIAEEIADVEIMLAQLKIIFSIEEKVAEWKSKKLDRLNKIFENG